MNNLQITIVSTLRKIKAGDNIQNLITDSLFRQGVIMKNMATGKFKVTSLGDKVLKECADCKI